MLLVIFLTSLYSLIDYIAISGSMERNVLEYAEHLHEHFIYPVSINDKGRYNVPTNPNGGYRCLLGDWRVKSRADFDLDIALKCTKRASRNLNGRMGHTGSAPKGWRHSEQ